MTRNPLRPALALAAVLALCFLPLASTPVAASPAASSSHLAPPPPPPPGGHTYFYCNWLGSWVRLKHIPNVPVERLADAVVVGKCLSLRTNDKFYKRLVGKNINVFFAPKEYPGVLVVHNGRQGFQPVLGAWTLPLTGSPTATLKGTVTDSASGSPIAGATVSARQCATKPTLHCTTYTDVSNAKGQYTIQFFQFGKWKVTATADGYAAGGSVTVTITRGKASILNVALVRKPTDVTLTLGVSPTPLTVNSPGTVTVTLSQAVSDGLVTFTESGTATGAFSANTCTPAAGTCSVTWTPSAPGTATISASWSGDTLYNPATNTATVTVNALSTTLAVSASPSPAIVGQTVSLTATLGTTATGGIVTFTGSGPNSATFPSQTCTPTAGTCSVTWQASAPGTWNITGSWSGSGAYGPATGSTSLVVNPSAAKLTLTANPTAPQVGQPTTLTATLSVPVADGTITFTGAGPAGSTFTQQTCVPTVVAAGSSSCFVSWTPSSPGNYSITATWSGDTQYPAGAQGTAQVAVGNGSLAISVTATPNPAALNQPVTLKAILTQPVNDGTILFTGVGPNNATFPQKSCTPSSTVTTTTSTCSVTWTPDTAGQWQISAFWSGDAAYSPVVTTIQVTVSSNSTSVTVSANPNPVIVNHPVQLTAQLTAGASGGQVTFTGTGPNGAVFNANPPNCVPSNGTCWIFWTPPTTGTWTIRAHWGGNGGFAAGDGTTSVVVNAQGFLTVAESPNPLQVGHTGTVTATVQQAQSGTVSFSGTGPSGQSYTASCMLNASTSCTAAPAFTPSAIGVWTINALFSTAAQNYTDSTLVNVTGTPTTMTLQATPNPPTVNQPTTLTATISPAVNDGNVIFTGSGPGGQAFVATPSNCVPTNGSCFITWTPTVAGNWSITASWGGDATHAPIAQPITISVATGNISITTDPSPPMVASAAQLTATLAFNASSGSTITWTGTGPNGEQLSPQWVTPSSCAITTGANSCTVTWTPDAAGDWTITATWSGDTAHPSGDHVTTTITVQAGPFSLSVSPTPPETVTSQVTVTAQLSDTSVNDGTMDFFYTKPDNSVVSTECTTVQNGACQSTITVDQTGTWNVFVTWNGDATHPNGAQATTQFVVNG